MPFLQNSCSHFMPRQLGRTRLTGIGVPGIRMPCLQGRRGRRIPSTGLGTSPMQRGRERVPGIGMPFLQNRCNPRMPIK